MRTGFAPTLILALLCCFASFAVADEEIWVLTTTNNLVNFMSSSPGSFSSRPITGMAAGEYAVGIDFRPAPPLGRLYALGNLGQLYLVANPSSGAASAVGAGGIALSGTEFGVDFNPTVDRIRVISDANQNLRLHPDSGVLVSSDGALAYASGDANFGQDPEGTGAAYTNNVSGATTTVLYDIDSGLDILATQAPPNAGTLNTVGSLGVDVLAVNGFDISGSTGTAYAALNVGGPQSVLYTINLMTGAATSVGTIGCYEQIRGLSVNNANPTAVPSSSWGRIKAIYR
jgi:uncharacterized protein DUF4394